MRPVAVTADNEALLARLDALERKVRVLTVLTVWLLRKEDA